MLHNFLCVFVILMLTNINPIANYGIVDDPKRPHNFVYGKETAASDHVDNTIKCPPMSKLAEYANGLNEAKYASRKREPLGQVMPRNYILPQAATSKDFRFGVPTADSTC